MKVEQQKKDKPSQVSFTSCIQKKREKHNTQLIRQTIKNIFDEHIYSLKEMIIKKWNIETKLVHKI